MKENKPETNISLIDGIIENLNHKSPFLREDAALALSHVNSEKAINALIKGLSDESEKVRAICARSLMRYGRKYSEKITPLLIDLLYDDNNEVAENAAQTLGIFGDKSALDALLELLANPAPNVRLYSVMALGRIADNSALIPLLKLFKEEKDKKVRATIIVALGNFQNPKLLPVFLKFGFTDPDPRVCASAVEAVTKMSVPPESVVPQIKKFLNSMNGRLLANSCYALYHFNDESYSEAIVKLIKSPEKWHRSSGTYVLGKIGDIESLTALIGISKDPDADVRLSAVKALGKINSTKALTTLIQMLDDTDEPTRIAAYNAILKYTDKFAFWPMVQNLKSPYEIIRFIAVKVLFNIDSPAALLPLFELYFNEKVEDVKNEAERCLTFLLIKHADSVIKEIFSVTAKTENLWPGILDFIFKTEIEHAAKANIFEYASGLNFPKASQKAAQLLEKLKS